jgi:hypothetical protein
MRPLSASLSGYDRFSGPRPYGEHTPFGRPAFSVAALVSAATALRRTD